MLAILGWILFGLIVGALAKLVMPGRDPGGLVVTILLGIVGALVGGLLFTLVQGPPSEPFSFSGNAWHGWIVAIVGGVLVLWVYGLLYPKRWWQ